MAMYLMQMKKTSKWSLMRWMIHRSKAQSQLKLIQSQTRKFQKLPTRRMVAKPQSLQTRNQLKNTATVPHLELEMVYSATIGTSSPMVIRTSILRTISPFTAFRGWAECFSYIVLACLRRNRNCQTSSSTWTSLLLMNQLGRVVSGQLYSGTQTYQKLELPYKIYLGSSKFTGDSFQEFVSYRTSHIKVNCTLLTTLSFKGQVT